MTPFERRTRDLQDRLAEGEGVILFPSPNLYYLSGFWEEPSERHLFLLIGEAGDPVFVVPALYGNQIATASWVSDVRTYEDGTDPMPLVREAATQLGMSEGTIFLDPTMWARFSVDLRRSLPTAAFSLAGDLLETLRITKDEAERDALRRAGDIADEVLEEVRALGAEVVGWTEAELAATIEERLDEAGGEGLSFPVIAGSGPNGAHPHHTHGDRIIEAGDPVVLDFGTRVDHYPSDQTRTLVFGGSPPPAFEDAYRAVRDAQAAAVRAVEPGVESGVVDAAARDVITDRGYGEAFIHRTGHGVGLSVHEAPYIVEDGTRSLEEGMVFSVEPGIYMEGEFGVRIEDLVVVTADGCERLNHTDRSWETGRS